MSEIDDLKARIGQLSDSLAIQRVISGVTLYSDLGDYARSEGLFTPDATLDYSYFFGAEAAALGASNHWKNVRKLVPGFDATHHQTTNLDVELKGDSATVTSLVRATLRVGESLCVDGGIYIHELIRTAEGWRITHQVFRSSYHEGGDVIAQARERAEAKSAGPRGSR